MKLPLILICFLLLSSLCANATEYCPMIIGRKIYMRIELAKTPAEHEHGLMFRTSLPSDGGMLFVFKNEAPHSFWMKNTLIPLDILFLDAQGKVVSMHRMNVEPPRRPDQTEDDYEASLPAYPSNKPAKYAIELPAGQIQISGIKIGDTIAIPVK